MRQLSFTIIAMAVSLTMSGQQLRQRQNNYRSNEILTKQRVETDIDELLIGKGKWSLEGAEVSKKKYRSTYTLQEDTLAGRERGERTNLQELRSQMDVVGSENYMGRMTYDMPETWLKFPMQLGDSVSGYFNGSGPYCERLFLRRFGTYLTKADAVGRLTLPDGSTLRNVIRLHTERHISAKVVPIEMMAREIPKFTVDSIVNNLKADGSPLREDIYRWYAEGYRYPVLEARTLTVADERTLEEVFICTPEVQEALAFDADNEAERQRLAAEQAEKSQGQAGSIANGKKPVGGAFAYDIAQDDGSSRIVVNYDTSRDVKVVALVANSQGYVFKRAEQQCGAGTGQFTIDCDGLNRGQYIIYINVDGEQAAEKVNLK